MCVGSHAHASNLSIPRMHEKESSELFSELPLFELQKKYDTPEGQKFLQESIISSPVLSGQLGDPGAIAQVSSFLSTC